MNITIEKKTEINNIYYENLHVGEIEVKYFNNKISYFASVIKNNGKNYLNFGGSFNSFTEAYTAIVGEIEKACPHCLRRADYVKLSKSGKCRKCN